MKKGKILIVDDIEETVFGYERYFEAFGFETLSADSFKAAQKKILSQSLDATLLDLDLPDGSGLDLIPLLRTHHPSAGIIIITGTGDIPTAVAAMQNGADHFLTKPVNMDELLVSVEKCLEIHTLRKQELMAKRLATESNVCFGRSRAMAQVRKYAEIASRNSNPVIITGETGTGKGMLAQWIHDNSSRKGGLYVEVNCSALKGELLRSELYGHVKGAFTSAINDRPGLIEAADQGTLFLDEIGDMDLEVQAQFLKTIEEKKFRRIGENMLRTSDFRIICATNKNMDAEVEAGRFRNDFLYRINVFPIEIPALRDRPEDIPQLAEHLYNQLPHQLPNIPEEIRQYLQNQPWKGNIRQLRNAIERALLLAEHEPLQLLHFHLNAQNKPSGERAIATWNLEEQEKKSIKKALTHFNGNKSRVCRELGISQSSLYRKLEKYKIPFASQEERMV